MTKNNSTASYCANPWQVSGKPGPKPSPDIFALPEKWEEKDNLFEFMDPVLLNRLKWNVQRKPADESWLDCCKRTFPNQKVTEGICGELLRLCLKMGFLTEEQLDPLDLPGELRIVCIDKGIAKIEQYGPVGTREDGKPDVSGHRIIIHSKLDGITLCLPTGITGSKRPYLTVEKRLFSQLPRLKRYLKSKGLFTNSKCVLVQRLVKAIEGATLKGLHADHIDCEPRLFGGFGTLDCRAAVLEMKSVEEHARKHIGLNDGHYLSDDALVLGGETGEHAHGERMEGW